MYGFILQVAALFHHKAMLWVTGRKNWQVKLRSLPAKSGKRVWFHCASLGEFEQARPLIEKIKTLHPETQTVLSFFSPSGYEVRKTYTQADVVTYLPLDTRANAQEFIALIKPDVVFFVKYDLWYNYLQTLHQQNIPVVLFSAVFRPNHVFFKWYGGMFRQMLKWVTQIFVQNETSEQLLKQIEISSTVASDTRFDRVLQVAENRKSFPLIEQFCNHQQVFIAGSTWSSDEELLLEFLANSTFSNWKLIIAPHQLSAESIKALKQRVAKNVVLFSELTESNAADSRVLLIDNIGNLASLYAYAHVAYVGGGFEQSIHNVLEPAVYGIPVVFGKNFTKSEEAKKLLQLRGAKCVYQPKHFEPVVGSVLSDHSLQKQMGEICHTYVHQHAGGTDLIYQNVKHLL